MSKKKKRKVKFKLIYTFSVLIGLASILALLYPYISDSWNRYVTNQIVIDYSKEVASISSSDVDYTRVIEEAREYNEKLYEEGTNNISSYTANVYGTENEAQLSGILKKSDEEYESKLSFNSDGVMGYISIPKINALLTIKHYTTSNVLATGVGHLYGSSLPVGGENSHTVLTGHSALLTAKLFTDLNKLKIGDRFTISTAGQDLNYEVDQIKVVLPDELNDLSIEEGQDLCTLVTCTPYAVNTHRLLVRGHRISDDADMKVNKDLTEKAKEIVELPVTMLVSVSLIVLGAVILIIYIWRKK